MSQQYVEDKDGNWVLQGEPEYQRIKATIRSREPVTLDKVDKFTESISYEKVTEVKFSEIYYTEILITIDQAAAKAHQEEYENDFPDPKAWTGDIWDWLEDGPASRMNEDNVLPNGCDFWDDVEIEYL